MKKSEILKNLIDLLILQDAQRGEKARYKAKRRELAEERQQRVFEAILRILPPFVEKIMPVRHDLGEPLGFELATAISALNFSLDSKQLDAISKILRTKQRLMMVDATRLAEEILGKAVPITEVPTETEDAAADVSTETEDAAADVSNEELHRKIATFLSEELARTGGHSCILIKLFDCQEHDLKGECLKLWDREEHPEIFEGQDKIEKLATEIIHLAENYSENFDWEKHHHFEVMTEQMLASRARLPFRIAVADDPDPE